MLINFRLAPSRVRLLHHRRWYTPWCDHIWVWWWDAVIWAWQEDTARKISWYCLQITVKESIWPLLSLGNTKDALRVYLSNIPPDLGLVLLEKIVKKSLFCRKKFSASQTLPPQTCMCYKDILGFIQLQFDKSLWHCWQQCWAEPFLRKFTVCMSVKGAAPNNGEHLQERPPSFSCLVIIQGEEKGQWIACALELTSMLKFLHLLQWEMW